MMGCPALIEVMMDIKKMREELESVVDTVPRKNDDVVKLYNEKFSDDEKAENVVSIIEKDNQYTYIGAGDTPPHMICFMGIQNFVRGELTTVTDHDVLAKIAGNQCFVKGVYDMDEAFEADKEAKKKVELQQEEDVKTQIYMDRENRKG